MKKISVILIGILSFLGPTMVSAAFNSGQTTETLPVGKSLNINLDANPNSTYTVNTSNSQVITAIQSNTSLLIKAINTGTAQATMCETISSKCFVATVNVSGVLGVNTTTLNSHSPGSWVNLGKTIYYVHSSGLIPISTWPIFLSVAPAQFKITEINEGDMLLPLLPLMELNDSRIK